MSLTHKQAEAVCNAIVNKFNSFARPRGIIDGVGIGTSTTPEAKDGVAEFQRTNDTDKYFLKEIFTVCCMTEKQLSKDEKEELRNDCARVLNRPVDETDIRFMGGVRITLH